jgi:hypothetical protein
MSRHPDFLKRLKLALSVAVLFVVLLIKLRILAPEPFDHAVTQVAQWFVACDAAAHCCAVWLRAMLLRGLSKGLGSTTNAVRELLACVDAVAIQLRGPRPAMSLPMLILVSTFVAVVLGALFSVADAVVHSARSGFARRMRWAALGLAWSSVYFWYFLVLYAYGNVHQAFETCVLRISDLLLSVAAFCIARCASLYLGRRARRALTLLNIALLVGAVFGREQLPVMQWAVSLVAALDMFLLMFGIQKQRPPANPLAMLTASWYAPALLIRPALPQESWALVAYFLVLAGLKLALWHVFSKSGDDDGDDDVGAAVGCQVGALDRDSGRRPQRTLRARWNALAATVTARGFRQRSQNR